MNSLGFGSSDIRERSFQNVVDTILRPSGIKVGGFPEEIFLDLNEDDKEQFTCNICYLIINDGRRCDNNHSFCRSCIVAWSLTPGENARKCPFCRCNQTEYHTNRTLDKLIGDKRVRCMEDGCGFKAPLKIFLMHSHGKAAYSNAEVDFEKLKPPSAHIFVLSPFTASNRSGRVSGIREQLLQGRMMIQQMMLLMHLEMQLRQQALAGYQEANEPAIRMQRLDDVMALNEQLNEVGSILSMLLSTPISRASITEDREIQSQDRLLQPSLGSLESLRAPTLTSAQVEASEQNASSPATPSNILSPDHFNATIPRLLSSSPETEVADVPLSSTEGVADDEDSDELGDRCAANYHQEISSRNLSNSNQVVVSSFENPRSHSAVINAEENMNNTTRRQGYTDLGRNLEIPIQQRPLLLSREQESRLRLLSTDYTDQVSAANSVLGDESSLDTVAHASFHPLTTLPRIQGISGIVSSAEIASEALEAGHTRQRNVQTPSEQHTTSRNRNSMTSVSSSNISSGLLGSATARRNHLPQKIARQRESGGEESHTAIRIPSHHKPIHRNSQQPRERKSRLGLLKRSESLSSEGSQEQLTTSNISGNRSTAKSTSDRQMLAARMPSLPHNRVVPTRQPNLISRQMLAKGDPSNRSSVTKPIPGSRSLQAADELINLSYPPSENRVRNLSNQTPTTNDGHSLRMRSWRRSEIRQELRRSLREQDD